jgi:hypothetical protein
MAAAAPPTAIIMELAAPIQRDPVIVVHPVFTPVDWHYCRSCHGG